MKLNAAINAVHEAETKVLVELYNHLTGKSIKKFQDRKTAENRVIGVLKAIPEQDLAQSIMGYLVAERESREAERRIEERRDHDPLEVDPNEEGACCPHCGIDLANGHIMHGDDAGNAGVIKLEERMFECHACGGEFGPFIPADREKDHNRSVAIAKSWQDPEVKRSRSQRHAVRVGGEEYRSVKAAFEALGLPLKEHIKFRMRLKEEEEMQAYGFYWEVIER